ncbi:MAG TPA: hypothetical protein VH834_19385 [Solirubrobacteraceae bacterium]|jgi:nucleotide-binding universal stress UspA family protein
MALDGYRYPLVVVRDGPAGGEALRVGIDAAVRGRGRLMIVCPTRAPQPWSWWIPPGFIVPNDSAANDRLLAAARAQVPADLPLTVQQLRSPPPPLRSQIANAAWAHRCDLIVLGATAARSGTRCRLADWLDRRTPATVLAVRAP